MYKRYSYAQLAEWLKHHKIAGGADDPLDDKLKALQTDLKGYVEKATAEKKEYGTMLDETKSTIDAIQKQVDAIDKKLVDRTMADAGTSKSLEEMLKEDESIARVMRNKSGAFTMEGALLQKAMERKTVVDSAAVGAQTTGVLQIERTPGITLEAREQLTVRNVLSARPTSMQVIDFVKVNAPMAIASPQTESSAKAENAVTFTASSEVVKTIATWIPASRQIYDDWGELANFINQSLPYYVNLEEELQLLTGSGATVNLHGLITQATSFNTGLLSAAAGWNKIDIIGRAIQQITVAKELQPTFAVVHPTDWWGMRLQKDGFGRYILGDPQQMVRPTLFGLDIVSTTNIASGTFLVGSGNAAASEIRDRMAMQVEISSEHSDYFTKNLVAVRAEKRLALIVKRAASYITGSFTTSP